MQTAVDRVSARAYYATYHGHSVELLGLVLRALKGPHTGVIYLAGDSSLDNKYWIDQRGDAVNGYECILEPPSMKTDVCYWLNFFIAEGRHSLFALNAAIEATTLGERTPGWFGGGLLQQDQFIQKNITESDYLIVSVGGNDIALSPSLSTIASIIALVHASSDEAIQGGSAWGMSHFVRLFRDQLQDYVMRLVAVRKPRKVLICMIYYPAVAGMGSWADPALSALSYNSNPQRLQNAIAAVFEHAVSQIHVPGTEVVPVPLFQILDGCDAGDYVARVEPSARGGRKMAEALLSFIVAPQAPSQSAGGMTTACLNRFF